MKTEDASERMHLSLVDSSIDYSDPNPGAYTFDERALGKGSWVVVINSGYNWKQFPEEFGTGEPGQRPLHVWRVPWHVRNRTLEQHELDGGHWAPDDDLDYAEPFEGIPEGHGTQTAMVAAGLVSGVAREAGLYLIKAGGVILDRDNNVVEEDVCADSLLLSFRHIVDKLKDGTLVPGKTVVLIDTLWKVDAMRKDRNRGGEGYQVWEDEVDDVLHELDDLGVSITISAGNDGEDDPPGPTDAYMPTILASKPNSPLIIVGAVNEFGQLARFSCPGSLTLPITCYAMGKAVNVIDLSVEQKTKQDGTTFSTAIVAGLVACYLSHPDFERRFEWNSEDMKGHTVGNRIKQWLCTEGEGSYQRVAPGNTLDRPTLLWRNYPIPERINTAYNFAHGSQGGLRELVKETAEETIHETAC